jgi:hypothetical protein
MLTALDAAWNEHDKLAQGLPAPLAAALGGGLATRDLALKLAQQTLRRFPHAEVPLILDPCCGCGGLLLGAVEWAARHRPSWLAPLLQQGRLEGWEFQRDLTDIARRVLTTAGKAVGVDAEPKLTTRDALVAEEREVYDAILLYPPWKYYGGRKVRELPAQVRSMLAGRYGSFAGTPALHTVFVELAGRLIRPETGRVGALLPFRAATSPATSGFRRYVAGHLVPAQVLSLGTDAMPGAKEEVGLVILNAGQGDSSGKPWVAREAFHADGDSPGRATTLLLPAKTFGAIGIHTEPVQDALVTNVPEKKATPFREGKDVNPFHLAEPRMFLRKVPPEGTGLYVRIAPFEEYENSVIVIRRDANRPLAALHDPPALFRDDVIACFGAPEHDHDFLVGVFNSAYYGRLYRSTFKGGRMPSSPVVTLEQLRSLPVPTREGAGEYYEYISDLSQQLSLYAGREPRLMEELNAAVEAAYKGR